MSSSYYGGRVPAPGTTILYDDGQQRRADAQRAKLAPLIAKAARGEKLTPYEEGIARSVQLGRAPRDLTEQANALLAGTQRRGTTGQGSGLTEAQVKKAIQKGLEPILDALRDLEVD